MNNKQKNTGFSLTEILLAMGIMTIGMLFIAGVFPVAIHFTTIATERTIASAAADEALAKIRLYAIGDPSKNNPGDDDIALGQLEVDKLMPYKTVKFSNIFPAADNMALIEYAYPSTGTDTRQKQYFWSALFRLTEKYDLINNPNPPVQITIFVSRRTSPNLKYPDPNDTTKTVGWPMPVKVEVEQTGLNDDELRIINDPNAKSYINDGCTIVDDETGRLYRVLQRYAPPPVDNDRVVLLERDWQGPTDPDAVWVVPPPENGGRYPCIAIYQTVIRF